jgi:hypothetical protein
MLRLARAAFLGHTDEHEQIKKSLPTNSLLS